MPEPAPDVPPSLKWKIVAALLVLAFAVAMGWLIEWRSAPPPPPPPPRAVGP
ncbi:MAG: hypothetical protein M3463_01695 [Verrucomicrobiota bacterium]|nr:hypothetical protein [Verrucomicrobiota bacterium]